MGDCLERYERYLENHKEWYEDHDIDEDSDEYEEPMSYDEYCDEYGRFNRY